MVEKKIIEKNALDIYNNILSMKSAQSGYKSHTKISEKITFPDGYVIDVQIIICEGDELPYVDVILYAPDKLEENCFTSDIHRFEGKYSLKSASGNSYTVIIEKEEKIEDTITLEYMKFFGGYKVPYALKKLAALICFRFTINGICDSMYIANLIAHTNNIGDGRGFFADDFVIENVEETVAALRGAYGSNIFPDDVRELKILLDSGSLYKEDALAGMGFYIKRLESENTVCEPWRKEYNNRQIETTKRHISAIRNEVRLVKVTSPESYDVYMEYSHENDNLYAIYDWNRVVGFVEIEKEGWINTLEILEEHQDKGYGRKTVNLLKEKYIDLSGLALFKSVPFWDKMGATFEANVFTAEEAIQAVMENDEDTIEEYEEYSILFNL